MMRRAMLRAVLGLPLAASDGLRRPLGAPTSQSAGPGVQPGVSSTVTIANRVIVEGTNGGIWVYVGQPALGNPPISSDSDSALDPFGNVTLPGVVSYQYLSVFTAQQIYGALTNYYYWTGTAWAPMFTSAIGNAGLSTATIGYGNASGNSGWQYGNGKFIITSGAFQSTAATAAAPSIISTDSWQAVTLPTGSTFAGSARVALLPIGVTGVNLAVFDINATFTTTAAGAQYSGGALPSSEYYPTAAKYAPLVLNQSYTTVANAVPRVEIPATSGDIQIFMPAFAAAGNTTIVQATYIYPTN